MKKSETGQRNALRIISGTYRSRRVHFPDAPGLRPTADRIRETLFNWLQDDIAAARCLDLFAGSGALGLEALSRGAAWVEFVDNNSKVKEAIAASLKQLNIDKAGLQCADAETWIRNNADAMPPFDIIFLDPPFSDNSLPKICRKLVASNLLNSGCRIYLETDAAIVPTDMPENWELLKSKQAGKVSFYLYTKMDDRLAETRE